MNTQVNQLKNVKLFNIYSYSTCYNVWNVINYVKV